MEPEQITVMCPDCGSRRIRIPALKAPEGYAFDASLVLVTCGQCDHIASLDACTFTEAELLERRKQASRDLYGTEPF